MEILIILCVAIISWIIKQLIFETNRKKRRDYYRNVYLKSEAWQRKRYVVLKIDHWQCGYCDAKATQVHHTRYAHNIGREPIDWLVSVCNSCHEELHS